MTQTEINDNQKEQDNKRVTRFYIILTVISIIVMIIAAYITYGYQAKTIVVSFDNVISKINDKNNATNGNTMSVGADLSLVPNDDVIEDILNGTIPNVCKDCDEDDPLDCLEKYEINKIIVQDPPHQNHLFIELVTGKNEEKIYTVVIDLANNNQVISAQGEINKKSCRDVVDDEEFDDELILKKGTDFNTTDYLKQAQ